MCKSSWILRWILFLGVLFLSFPGEAQPFPSPAPNDQNGPTTSQSDGYDAQIQQEVAQELQKHDWARNIGSSVKDGIVTLEGTVPVYIDKIRAYEKIYNKPRVEGVRNNIAVTGPSIADDELKDKLADQLRYDRLNLGSVFNNFGLVVKNGVVTLTGDARSPVDAESALAIVSNTPGVKDVIDDVRVLPVSGFDDDIRVAVARAIYGKPALRRYAMDPQRPIRIIVDRGHVTLWGVVASNVDRQIAYQAARSVRNVFSVKDNLVVANQNANAKAE